MCVVVQNLQFLNSNTDLGKGGFPTPVASSRERTNADEFSAMQSLRQLRALRGACLA